MSDRAGLSGAISHASSWSAAGDRGQDRDLVAVLDGRVEAVHEADVLAADVDVDEPTQSAVLGDPAPELPVAVVEGVEHLADGRALDFGRGLPTGGRTQLRRDLHRDCHCVQLLITRAR